MNRNEWILSAVVVLFLLFLVFSNTGCAGSESPDQPPVSLSAGDNTGSLSTEATAVPRTVTVKLKNRLVGQIRQINGYDGWRSIGGDNLVLSCTEAGGTVTCAAYPYEPYPYEVEVVP